jgi:diguanylate cyclase (GGDEF)-like protein
MGNDNFVFTIDPTVEDPGEFGAPIVFTPALHNASTGIASVDDRAYEDAWGRFYSSYSPVFNSKGEVAGIVAVDFDADWYEDKIHQLVWTTAIIIGASIFFGLLLTLLTANRYHGRFVRLSMEMGELSNGIEDLVHEITPEAEIEKEDNEMIREEPTLARDEIAVIGDEIRAMQNKLKERIQYIRSRAYYDSLTGLKNRDAYDDAVEKQDGRIDEGKANFSVVVLDINQLKNINDDYGHEQGDRIIREISKAMKKVFPPEKVYRIGGDEFAAILAGVDQKDNMEALRGLLRELNEKETVLNTDSVEISVSMGSAIYDRERDSRYIDVFKRADTVMYGDKRAFYQNHEDRRKKKE